MENPARPGAESNSLMPRLRRFGFETELRLIHIEPEEQNMKIIISALMAVALVPNAMAQQKNSYAPTLADVVVLRDTFEDVYSPFPHHLIMGEFLEMDRDPTCQTIRVNQ